MIHPHWWWRTRVEWFVPRFSSTLPVHALTAYVVVVWPELLLRFVAARKTATAQVVDSHRPGASLAALGWLLLAAGALQFAFPLVVPIATLVFVQHHLRREGAPPTAR